MSQVESMLGAKILTPIRRGIEDVAAVYDRRMTSTLTGLDQIGVVPRVASSPQPWAIGLQPFQGWPALNVQRGKAPAQGPAPATFRSTMAAAVPVTFRGRMATSAAKPGTETSPDVDVEEKLKEAFARGWSIIVWNDPVNLMDYVVMCSRLC